MRAPLCHIKHDNTMDAKISVDVLSWRRPTRGRAAGRWAGEEAALDRILEGYAEAAAELIPRYEAVSSSELYSEVAHLLPEPGRRVIDIGAGTGRDAGWLAARGCRVLAVEPVVPFREVGGTLHRSPHIEWLDDSLPALRRVLQRGETFDFTLLSAVWQHIDGNQRELAMPNLRALVARGGRLLLSVRHGPGVSTRPCFSATAEDAVELAQANGFRLVSHRSAASIQTANRQAGVTWTWLAFSTT
jgi:SAM-dependent methyltransferase